MTHYTLASRRYRALVSFITVFVLAVVGVLGLNTYISSQFQSDAVEITLAGRQLMLSQRIVKSLQNVARAEQSGADVNPAIAELQSAFLLFDSTLNGFHQGGETIDGDGRSVTLRPVSVTDARTAIDDGQLLWSQYRLTLLPLIEGQNEPLQLLANATADLTESNAELLAQMNDLSAALEASGAEPFMITLVNDLGRLTQEMAKLLYEVAIAQQSNQSVNPYLTGLDLSISTFDESLLALDQGGQINDVHGQQLIVEPLEDDTARQIIDETRLIWAPVRDSLQALLESDSTILTNLGTAINAAYNNNLEMLELMGNLTQALKADSERRSSLLRLIQIVGIAIALLMFGVIVFHFLKQLGRSDSELNLARAETESILQTVNNGLFLLDPDFVIGSQYSDSLRDMLNVAEPSGKNLIDILRPIVTAKTLETAREFIELLFGDRVNEDLVNDLNPLHEVEVLFTDGDIENHVRHLKFSFKRVRQDDRITHLLVQVNDVTERIELQRHLKTSQEKSQHQFNMLMQVLHVEPPILRSFLGYSEKSLNQINDILEERAIGTEQNSAKLDRIARTMHSIKGDAAALGLGIFENEAHEFEDLLEVIRNKKHTSGKDFLPLTIKLNEFLGQIESLKTLLLRLNAMHQPAAANERTLEPVEDSDPIERSLQQLAARVASDEGKTVQLDIDGISQIPQSVAKSCSDILVQLTRNAIVHGIESEDYRLENGKTAHGNLTINVSRDVVSGVVISCRDDGCGLSTRRIASAAIETGLITREQTSEMLPNQIIGLIFRPGFTTASGTGKHAGRGAGMDVVAATIKQLNGKISVKSVVGQFCEFIIRLPNPDTASHPRQASGA